MKFFKIFALVLAFCGALGISAQTADKEYLLITHADASQEKIDLSTILRVSFISDNTIMRLTLPNARTRNITINETDRFSFYTEKGSGTEDEFGSTYTVTPAEGDAYGPATVGTVLCKRGAQGSGTTFAFSEVTATEAGDLRNSAHYAVQFSVSAARMGSEISLSGERNSYTLTLFDYTTGTYVEAADGIRGTLLVKERSTGKYAFRLNATLADGTKIEAENDGDVVFVDDLEGMVPLPILPNEYTVYNPDGTLESKGDIVSMQLRESTDGNLYFYFLKEGQSPDDYYYYTPQIMVEPAFVNAGEVKINETSLNWAAKYIRIQLSYATNQWMPAVDNGVLKVAYDATTQMYDIYLSVIDSYMSSGYAGGSKNTLTISYKGPASKYTGSKK